MASFFRTQIKTVEDKVPFGDFFEMWNQIYKG